MAITLNAQNSRAVPLDEFIEHVQSNVDLQDTDSICSAAEMLRGLANDRDLVVRQLNNRVKDLFQNSSVASTQVLFLGSGQGFFVRANFWPSSADISAGRVLQDQFAYHIAHDHNYNFMTVGYHGPGYFTEIFEYDSDALEGYVGESVDLRFLERIQFRQGMVMLYRASKDVHVQQPPEDLSITLNFMVSSSSVRLRDQFFFDLERKVLIEYPLDVDSSLRVSLIKIAGAIGNGNTTELLHNLSRTHPCRRTRLAAFQALEKLTPENTAAIWELACKDSEPLISQTGRKTLAALL